MFVWCWSCGHELKEEEASLKFAVTPRWEDDEDTAYLCGECHVEAINKTRKGK